MNGGRLQGKVAIITGASTGLGPVMASVFVQQGAQVLLAARREQLVQEAAANAGGGAIGMRADVTDEDDVVAMVARAVDEFGHVDVMCNNAAAPGQDRWIWEQTLQNWNETIAIDVTAAMLCTREVLKQSMLERRSGVILNFSSTAAFNGMIRKSHYVNVKGLPAGVHQGGGARSGGIRDPLQLHCAGQHRHGTLARLGKAHRRRAERRLRGSAGAAAPRGGAARHLFM